MMEMSASGPYGPKMGMRSDSVIRLGTWPTKSLALVDDDPVSVELSIKVPDLAAAAVAREDDLGADSCISGIILVGAATAAGAAVLRCCGCSVAGDLGDLGDLAAVMADEREDMDGMASFSGKMPGV